MEGGRSDLRATSRDILRLIHSHVELCRACSELRGLGQRNTRSTGDGMLSTLLARRMRTGMCGAANGSTDSTFVAVCLVFASAESDIGRVVTYLYP